MWVPLRIGLLHTAPVLFFGLIAAPFAEAACLPNVPGIIVSGETQVVTQVIDSNTI